MEKILTVRSASIRGVEHMPCKPSHKHHRSMRGQASYQYPYNLQQLFPVTPLAPASLPYPGYLAEIPPEVEQEILEAQKKWLEAMKKLIDEYIKSIDKRLEEISGEREEEEEEEGCEQEGGKEGRKGRERGKGKESPRGEQEE